MNTTVKKTKKEQKKPPPIKHFYWKPTCEAEFRRFCVEYPPTALHSVIRKRYHLPDPMPPDYCTVCIEIAREIFSKENPT